MTKESEYKGIWWLPDNPETRVHGSLRLVEEGLILDLIGSFKEFFSNPEIILGFSSDGKKITLHKCFEIDSRFAIPGFQTSLFEALEAFVGVHFQTKDEIKFKSLSVHYSHLNLRSHLSGLCALKLPQRKGEEELLISCKPPEVIQVDIGDYKVCLEMKLRCNFSPYEKAVDIKEKTYVTIESAEERSFEDLKRSIKHIQDFLTLLVGQPVYPLEIEARTELSKEIMNDEVNYLPVQVYLGMSRIFGAQQFRSFYVPFNVGNIGEWFRNYLKGWFEKKESLESVYTLYLGTLYNPSMYPEQKFLSLVYAIEAYHRHFVKNCELPEVEHKRRLEEILSASPEKHRTWLQEKLKYSNEPSLRKRLKEIMEEISKNMALGELIPNQKIIVDDIVTTRNYLVHNDENLKEKSAKGEKLLDITEKLRTLVKICLFKELGFTPEEIKHLIGLENSNLEIDRSVNTF
ncbi:MAG: hypothetical protein H5T94_04165 [Pseudothermotoga sp.]|nr:MAG: Uncharacterized protein XD41_1697 [Desulfonauticus sp. 38_4375]MBC7122419.1 hypothetical protein [Pseudothermotoga sp.]